MTRKLKIIKKGTGSPLLVLHGWGMNSAVWQPIATTLETHFCVSWLDLPGHGINRNVPFIDLEHSSALIAAEISEPTAILGWSLGGLLAQQIASQHTEKVSYLYLVASSPCFIQKTHWQTAISAEILQSFSDNLSNDFSGTLKRFLALQFLGVRGVQKQLKILRETLLANLPTSQALITGLDILRSADFSQQATMVPMHWILGELDRLVPITVADKFADLPHTLVTQIAQAGHAPFISHPEAFMQAILGKSHYV